MRKVLLLPTLLTLASACSQLDQHSDAWRRVAIGDTREAVQQVMGAPQSQQSIELPLVQLEQLAWRSYSGRVYLVHFAMGHALTKVVVD